MTNSKEIMAHVWSHMTSEPFSIDYRSTLKDAIESMIKHGIGSLVVTNGASIALLTEREILYYISFLGQIPDKELYGIMLGQFTKVSPKTPIDEAARTMISNRTRLLVYEQNDMVGIITASDLVKAFFNTTDRSPSLESVVTRNIISLDHHASILEAIKLMNNKRIGSIIVTVNGLHDGIFTERDLLTKVLGQNVYLANEVGNYCSNYLLTARLGISAREAAKLMFANSIKRLPLTLDGRVVGIVTARDLVESFISE